jgi:predicted metal-dependent phosphoesterase TrpH
MRIAVISPAALDRPGPAQTAAHALADALADLGAEALLIGPGRSPALLTEGRLAVRALERSGAAALAPTGRGPRPIAVGLAAPRTWAADAALTRILRAGGLDLAVLVGGDTDDGGWIAATARREAPALEEVGTTAPKRTAKALVAAAGDPARAPSPLTPADPILADFHLHSVHSHDCSTEVEELAERALELGLGALCVTDHDTVAGGYAARAHVEAHGIPLEIAPSSEVKSRTGEAIGIYLREDVPPGLPFADTVEALRDLGAFVYVPHPFDGFHAIPDAALLERLAPLIDCLEVANGRLARESFNHEALAFATRLGLPQGAGSDAHVAAGLFTAGLELPAFHDAASLALAIGDARIVRNPRSFLALQARKWLRTRRTPARAE